MDNLRGILLMTLAMLGFAITDAFLKAVTVHMPVGQVICLLGIGGFIIFSVWAKAAGQSVFTRDWLRPMVIARNASEAVATASFITALSILPLSTVSAILQANPLFVTMGAALFLGEAVGPRRWAAIAVGFCGMLLILRPTTDGLDAGALLAVLAMILLAVRDLTTRAMPKHLSNLVLAAYAFATLIVTGGVMMLFHTPVVPNLPEAGLMGLAVVSGAVAYYCITAAMRVGEVSAVTPFRYTRLVFAMLIGILIFGERPDTITYVGAAIIIAAGLYTFARERKRRIAATLSEMAKAG